MKEIHHKKRTVGVQKQKKLFFLAALIAQIWIIQIRITFEVNF
jgi:hypothetical protein